jgi:hypothetical protein
MIQSKDQGDKEKKRRQGEEIEKQGIDMNMQDEEEFMPFKHPSDKFDEMINLVMEQNQISEEEAVLNPHQKFDMMNRTKLRFLEDQEEDNFMLADPVDEENEQDKPFNVVVDKYPNL